MSQVKFIISGFIGIYYGIKGTMEVEKGQIFSIDTPDDQKHADIWVADGIAECCDAETVHEDGLELMVGEPDIAAALLKLDPENDEHWTQGGKPSVDVVRELLGDDEIKRGNIDDVDPDFDREKALEIATQSD